MARTRRNSARYTASTVSRAGLAAGLVSQCSTKSRSGALFTPADQRTPEQAARVALDDALIAQVQAADVVVLGVPMYNFGVPAQLKNWIDAISRAGVTFRYTANGPEGLLKGKKVHVAPPAAVSTGIRRRIRRCLT